VAIRSRTVSAEKWSFLAIRFVFTPRNSAPTEHLGRTVCFPKRLLPEKSNFRKLVNKRQIPSQKLLAPALLSSIFSACQKSLDGPL
jgi:hypothetical protein